MEKVTILVVDDQQDFLEVITDILDSNNFKIIHALNGKMGIEVAKKFLPDMVITDWEMPEMDGIEMIKTFKISKILFDIPIVICSGIMTSSQNLKAAFDAGAIDYIRKPIDPIELIARVNSALLLSHSLIIIKNQKKEILSEKEKIDNLLLSVFPKKVALDLKKFGKNQPDLYNNVTVFISDIISFTKKAANMGVRQLANELNDVFHNFDIIMERNYCERIKTVGDAYFAVCGMHYPDPEHAYNITKAATEIIEYLKERNKTNKHKWEIRVGIHSGEIIGCIIGKKKYVYDIFGDTVNTASRLEKTSKPMQIHISETTYRLINDKFIFKGPSLLNVKGIGEINSFYINTK